MHTEKKISDILLKCTKLSDDSSLETTKENC